MSTSALSIRNKATRLTTAKRYRKRLIRYSLLAGNLAIVAVAIFFVVRDPSSNAIKRNVSSVTDAQASNPLDTLSAADIAANASIMAGLPETGFIINYADSVRTDLTTPISSDTEIVAKPQILSSAVKTKADIQEYTTVAGDTLAVLASKLGVTSDSIKWSNGLSGSNVGVGVKLVAPPSGMNGIVYTVKAGDTPESLASKFKADKNRIISFNDAEITGLKAGDRILIPDGSVAAVASLRTPFYAGFAFGSSAIYGYNGYVPGYCTWYVANKRIAIGRPLPANLGNAAQWDNRAPQGWDRNPRYGDAVVTNDGGAGHVAFVEQVYEDGSVRVSEMNFAGLYRVTERTFGLAEAKSYKYIH